MLLVQEGERKMEEYIVEALHTSGQSGPTLLSTIAKNDSTLSKETFYRTLRKLLREEVLNKNKGIYQLNRHWLQRVYRFSKKHIETNEGIDTDNILAFEEGDKISYKFKNPNLMGIYWAHTYDMIFEIHDPKIPILIFHPHEWLIHTRVESESFFLSRIAEDKKTVLFALGSNTPLDKKFNKEWSNKYLQIATGINYGLKNTEYINVLGDFIFKVSTSKKFANDIEVFFQTHREINEANREELIKLCNRKDTARMVFTRSKKEAHKWRAKFKKHFYVPQK